MGTGQPDKNNEVTPSMCAGMKEAFPESGAPILLFPHPRIRAQTRMLPPKWASGMKDPEFYWQVFPAHSEIELRKQNQKKAAQSRVPGPPGAVNLKL